MPTHTQPPNADREDQQAGDHSLASGTRRDFLKLFAAGLLGALYIPFSDPYPNQIHQSSFEAQFWEGLVSYLEDALHQVIDDPAGGLRSQDALALPAARQGRVAYERIPVHKEPSFDSQQVATHWKDSLLSVTGYVLGDRQPAHNRVWYRLGDAGFAHSGGIQPVETRPHNPMTNVPPGGRLAEVCVPFTDASWGPGPKFPHIYRFYYQTTHWVTGLATDEEGVPWYRLLDDKWDYVYYVPARHLRPVFADELAPVSPGLPLRAKRLEVLRDRQLVIAYEWNRPVFAARAATGARFSNGDFSTPAGYHITSYKRPYRHMAAGNLAYNGYDLPGVPWVTYFTGSGVSFHGTFWHNNFGKPRSHGCVNLSPAAARWLYRWTLPTVPPDVQEVAEEWGTSVEVI